MRGDHSNETVDREGLELERYDEPPGGEGAEDEGGDGGVRESDKSGRGERVAGEDEESGIMHRLREVLAWRIMMVGGERCEDRPRN